MQVFNEILKQYNTKNNYTNTVFLVIKVVVNFWEGLTEPTSCTNS